VGKEGRPTLSPRSSQLPAIQLTYQFWHDRQQTQWQIRFRRADSAKDLLRELCARVW